MPEYMLLIYTPADNPLSPEKMAEMSPKWDEFTESLREAGVYVAGNALQGTELATTVRERDGQTQITDGPFAETKEVLGGYYLLEAPDLDTVLGHAARVPNIAYGSTEVRPILDTSGRQARVAEARASA
jgi:hypothetical protein